MDNRISIHFLGGIKVTFEQWHEKHKDEVVRLWTDKTDPDDDGRYPMIDYLMLRDVTLAISAQDQEVAV